VDGDTLDEKEWLEGPFHQHTTVSTLLEIKRQGRSFRRSQSRYLRINEGKSVGRVKMTQRKPGGSLSSLQRGIAPIDSGLPKLDESKNPYNRSQRDNSRGEKGEMVVEPLSEKSPRQLLRRGQRLSLDSLYAGELQRRRNEVESNDAMESSSIDLTLTPEANGDLVPGYALPPGHERYSQDKDEDLSKRVKRKGTPHPHQDYVVPKFKLGTQVIFCDNEAHVSGGGKITKVIKPGERGNHYRSLMGAFDPEMEVLYEIDTVAATQCL
jgi:hypothetical protein